VVSEIIVAVANRMLQLSLRRYTPGIARAEAPANHQNSALDKGEELGVKSMQETTACNREP